MSTKRAKVIITVFILLGVALSVYFTLQAETGNFLVTCGGVLMFVLLYSHPEALLVSKSQALDEHIVKFKKVDYLMLICALAIGVSGVIFNWAF